MTPETYMRRFHGDVEEQEDVCCPLIAEDLYPDYRNVPASQSEERRACGIDEAGERPGRACCCKGSLADALRLLCGDTLGSLVDFDAFFFLTGSLAIGSALSVPGEDTDNISAPEASLRRFSPCSCDLLDVSGTAYFAVPGSSPVALEDVDQLSLCALKAVAFGVAEADCERECGDTNYDRAVRAIRRAIRAEGGDTNACARRSAADRDCDDCCCAEGLLTELSTRNLSRTATLTVGGMVLQNVTVLGSVGSALVLTDTELERFYLVCANAIEALG